MYSMEWNYAPHATTNELYRNLHEFFGTPSCKQCELKGIFLWLTRHYIKPILWTYSPILTITSIRYPLKTRSTVIIVC